MNDLDRIEHELQHGRLNHNEFERFAQDQLSAVYAGFTPITGGTDWGRDGDIAASSSDDATPVRVLITSSRTLEGVRSNMSRGIKSMNEHGVAADRLVLANPAKLNLQSRERLVESALKAGARLDASDIFEQSFFASRLRRDGYWRERLLGLSSEPISLTRVAPDLAESPWIHIPLIAREEDLAALEGDNDMIVVGPPGVGKSRLIGEIDGVAFVDPGLSSEQVVKDLRWLAPATVVVDDASAHLDLVRRLVALRRSEPDVFRYRVIGATWPDGVERLEAELREAAVHEVGLIERGPMDQLLRSMGLSGGLARAEIMNQAEGRPGWAVALADPLLRSGETTSLVNGRALLGHVRRYLLRVGLEAETMDLLAVMSALGSVAEGEFAQIADEVGMSRAEAARAIERWARGGLVDARQRGERMTGATVRRYTVRPPMLARVLVAERVFEAQFPVIDFDGVVKRWPDRHLKLAQAAIESTLLGSNSARPHAERLGTQVLTSDSKSVDERVDLAIEYARLGRAEAEFVVGLASVSLDSMLPLDSQQSWVTEPLVRLVSTVMKWYPEIDGAYDILFDVCAADQRPPHSHPGSAIRRIEDLVQDFHPEFARDMETRFRVLSALELWLAAQSDAQRARCVASAVAEIVLSLSVDGTHTDPANPMSIQIYKGIVPPVEMRRIHDEALPRLLALLDAGSADLEIALIDAASEWLRVGGGFERSFGRVSPEEEKAAATMIGRSLVVQLVGRCDLSLGGTLKLRTLVDDFELPHSIEVPHDIEPLVRENSYRSADFEAEQRILCDDIRSVGSSWATEPPNVVLPRLVSLRSELERSNLNWPNRIELACTGIAESTSSPVEWLDEAWKVELLSDAFPFARAAYEKGHLDDVRLQQLLDEQRTRHPTMWMLLQSEKETADSLLGVLEPIDYQALWILCLRGEMDAGHIREFLVRASPEVRAMVAVAFFAGRRSEENWSPGSLEGEWIDALWHLRPGSLEAVRDYELDELIGYLARRYPETLVGIVERAIHSEMESEGGAYRALPHGGWDKLQHLPPAAKSRLRNEFRESGPVSWILNQHLVGTDVAWLEHAIDEGEMSVDEAISYCSGMGGRPSVEALARALVPRGAAPEQIAGVMQWGSFSGERSDHYQSMIDELQNLIAGEDVDESVRAVAKVGIAGFSEARDEAAKYERTLRIRGER
jgi:hypothetical protein